MFGAFFISRGNRSIRQLHGMIDDIIQYWAWAPVHHHAGQPDGI